MPFPHRSALPLPLLHPFKLMRTCRNLHLPPPHRSLQAHVVTLYLSLALTLAGSMIFHRIRHKSLSSPSAKNHPTIAWSSIPPLLPNLPTSIREAIPPRSPHLGYTPLSNKQFNHLPEYCADIIARGVLRENLSEGCHYARWNAPLNAAESPPQPPDISCPPETNIRIEIVDE